MMMMMMRKSNKKKIRQEDNEINISEYVLIFNCSWCSIACLDVLYKEGKRLEKQVSTNIFSTECPVHVS